MKHWAIALKELFNANNEIKIIGARHGEKMYESLCGKEEMSKAEDLGDFYRIPADFRDLNYTKYLATDPPRLQDKEYNSGQYQKIECRTAEGTPSYVALCSRRIE